MSAPSIPRCAAPVLFTLLMLLPASACSSLRPALEAAPPDRIRHHARVTVQNQHVQDMRVYLVRGTTSVPMGFVATLETRTFRVPASLLGHSGTVRLMADPLGSARTFTSPAIPAGPGDQVLWTLAPNLRLSTFTVR